MWASAVRSATGGVAAPDATRQLTDFTMARIVAGVCVVVLTLGQGWATARVQNSAQTRVPVNSGSESAAILDSFMALLWWLGKGAVSTSRAYDGRRAGRTGT